MEYQVQRVLIALEHLAWTCVVNPICDRIRVVVRTRTIVRLTSRIGKPSDISWFRTRPVLATCACQHESESTHPHRQEQWFSATNVQWNIGRRTRGCCNVTTSPHSIVSPLLWLAVVQPSIDAISSVSCNTDIPFYTAHIVSLCNDCA